MKKKVLIVGKIPPPIGGVTIYTVRLAHYLSENNYKVKIISYDLFGIILLVFYGFFYKNIIIQSKKFYHFFYIYFWILKNIFNKEIFCVFHSLRDNSEKYKKIINGVTNYLVVNDIIKEKLCNGNNNSKILKISPFIPPCEEEKKYFNSISIPKNRFIISFNASKIVRENNIDIYGIDTIIKFFKEIYKLDETFLLILVIPYLNNKEYLNDLIIQNKIPSDKIFILNNNVYFPEILKQSNVFIRPTRTDGDSISLKEALYFNIPCFATDCVERPKNVILFKTGDHLELSKKFLEIYKTKNSIQDKINFDMNESEKYLKLLK